MVTLVELKDIQLPDSMKRAMARQAEAEREKRAKIIAAEGESLAADALGDASDIMMAHPLALQLRNLQSLVEIGVDKNTTVVFPAPLMSTIGELGTFLARETPPPYHADRDGADQPGTQRKTAGSHQPPENLTVSTPPPAWRRARSAGRPSTSGVPGMTARVPTATDPARTTTASQLLWRRARSQGGRHRVGDPRKESNRAHRFAHPPGRRAGHQQGTHRGRHRRRPRAVDPQHSTVALAPDRRHHEPLPRTQP